MGAIGKLRYAGKGQIVREADGALVSPRALVETYNDLLDISNDFKNTLRKALDIITQMSMGGGKAKGGAK